MIILTYLKKFLQNLLGISDIVKNVEDLQKQNVILATHVLDHQKTIALLAVTHARNLKDILAMVDELSGKRKEAHLKIKRQKDDDGVVN